MSALSFERDDGGREAAGFKGKAGDCVCRAIAIASGRPYGEVYQRLADGTGSQRVSKHHRKRGVTKYTATARAGIFTRRKWFRDYMAELGFEWVSVMGIGTGCTTHLADDELPAGRLVVAVSKHYTAVIDWVIRDTFDPRRRTHETGVKDGVSYSRTYERCVYGYWRKTDD